MSKNRSVEKDKGAWGDKVDKVDRGEIEGKFIYARDDYERDRDYQIPLTTEDENLFS